MCKHLPSFVLCKPHSGKFPKCQFPNHPEPGVENVSETYRMVAPSYTAQRAPRRHKRAQIVEQKLSTTRSYEPETGKQVLPVALSLPMMQKINSVQRKQKSSSGGLLERHQLYIQHTSLIKQICLPLLLEFLQPTLPFFLDLLRPQSRINTLSHQRSASQ